jgi:hypothetical protein
MKSRMPGWKSIAVTLVLGSALMASGCGMMDRMRDGRSAAQGSKVTLSGAEEVPPNPSSASGSGTIVVAPDGAVSGSLETTGFTPTMGHIHMAARGANGPVIVPLTHLGDGKWTVPAGAKLTPEQLRAYREGNLYVNVHSVKYPGGEVRAQLRP